jgi:hypothetical protein
VLLTREYQGHARERVRSWSHDTTVKEVADGRACEVGVEDEHRHSGCVATSGRSDWVGDSFPARQQPDMFPGGSEQ